MEGERSGRWVFTATWQELARESQNAKNLRDETVRVLGIIDRRPVTERSVT